MADEGFKHKLTAILSADVAEYSRMMRDDKNVTIRYDCPKNLVISSLPIFKTEVLFSAIFNNTLDLKFKIPKRYPERSNRLQPAHIF